MQASVDAADSGLYEQHWSNGNGGRAQDSHRDGPQKHNGVTYHSNGHEPRESLRKLKQEKNTSARRAAMSGALAVDSSSRHSGTSKRSGPIPGGSVSFNATPRRHNTGVRSPRASRVAQLPVDILMLEDYETSARRRRSAGHHTYEQGPRDTVDSPERRGGRSHRQGRSSGVHASGSIDKKKVGQGSLVAAASAETYHFRVRLHECRGVFAHSEELGRAPPAVYFVVHTTEERGSTAVGENRSYNTFFKDEFMFSSVDPEHDALVCTLVSPTSGQSSKGSPVQRDKKVAECVLALHNLSWHRERKVWVPLVHHPATPRAYEQGKVLVSIYSEDFGYDNVATDEEEKACAAAIHESLIRYAPEELHRLDWMTAAYLYKGPEALAKLCASYRLRTMQPVPVHVTVQRVDGLTDEMGRPTRVSEVYVVVSDGCVEQQSKMVQYRRGAIIKSEFDVTLANPEVDTLSLMVFGNGRKLGEAIAGLTNVQAGKVKEVTLMLVRAAGTGDASNGGQVTITLQTQKYSSPNQMSAAQEARLRERVLAYLWCYLRDDLHRLDAIVSAIDDEEMHMKEWARTVGPEKRPRHLTMSVQGARNVHADRWLSQRCYARISVGPTTVRTELATNRNGAFVFREHFSVCVYDPAHDAIEIMIVAEGVHGEQEVGRVCLGVANLPRQRAVVRTLHLVAAATKRDAHVQGEVNVELVAEDFGLTGTLSHTTAESVGSASSQYMQRLEAIMQRSSPERLHRVPFMLDTAPPGEAERVVENQAKQYGGDVAVAPMTVKILGVKGFRPDVRFHVKVYLNNESILRTRDVKGSAEVIMNIDHRNETTVRLKGAAQALMIFEVVAQHSMFRKTEVLGTVEIALASLLRGEKNVLWVPFFRPLKESAFDSSENSDHSFVPCFSNRQKGAIKGNRMPNSSSRAAPWQPQLYSVAPGRQSAPTPLPVGLLGVELQSAAFPATTVTEFKLDDDCGRVGESAREAVTHDVTSLIAKMRPTALSKVQPMIAQCTSLKAAHDELRAELSRSPIAATVYVNIESVDLATEAGKLQEARGEIVVEAVCGSERQQSHKRIEFENDALHQREVYTQIRLDIPERCDGAINSPSGPFPRTAACNQNVPALELRLVGVYSGDRAAAVAQGPTGGVLGGSAFVADAGRPNYYETKDSSSDTSTVSYYAGGANNINSYVKVPKGHSRRWHISHLGQKSAGGPSGAVVVQQQQEPPQSHQGQQLHSNCRSGAAAPLPYTDDHRNIADSWRRNDGEKNDKYRVGGGGGNHRYLDSSLSSRPQSFVYAERTLFHQHAGLINAAIGNQQQGSAASPSTTAASALQARSAPYRGEIGVVRLSLRALLTKPLYKVGDTLRVPIVAPMIPAKLSQHSRHSPEVNQHCIVGHVTLRLTLPGFERVPSSLRLGSRHGMSKVVPSFVHYYERRIGAYLRLHIATDLATFHYNLYERDVVSGCWPVSLPNWLNTLVEQWGPEVGTFGPVPALPFDPEELEVVRHRYKALCCEQALALARSARCRRGASLGVSKENSAHSSRSLSLSAVSRGYSRMRAEAADKKRGISASRKHDAVVVPVEPVYSF